MVAMVLALTPKDFYKSMKTYADHKVWQDVYRPTTKAGEVYLKSSVVSSKPAIRGHFKTGHRDWPET